MDINIGWGIDENFLETQVHGSLPLNGRKRRSSDYCRYLGIKLADGRLLPVWLSASLSLSQTKWKHMQTLMKNSRVLIMSDMDLSSILASFPHEIRNIAKNWPSHFLTIKIKMIRLVGQGKEETCILERSDFSHKTCCVYRKS